MSSTNKTSDKDVSIEFNADSMSMETDKMNAIDNNDTTTFDVTEMDMVKITGLKVDAIIGVFDWERAITQPLVIDVVIYTDIKKSALSDDITDAINYKSVCDDITKWCEEAQANLIEYLAEMLATNILEIYPTKKVAITVAKPTAIKAADAVAVSIVRTAK